MSRKALKIIVTLKLQAVSCPGVWLYSNNEVYLSVCIFGHYRRTRLAEPVFPLRFQQRFKFEKVFYSAADPSEVAALLESESVLFELVQLSDNVSSGAELLASYEDCARDFLYPCPQLSPTYGCMEREALMERERCFPGIAPKIEFSTSAIVTETVVPRPRSRGKETSVADTPKQAQRSPSPRKQKTDGRSFVYPDVTEASRGYQQQTISSVSRSRSPSPGKLNLADLSFGDSAPGRPDFFVRKVDDSLTQRKPGSASPPRKFPSPLRLSSRLSSRNTSPVRHHLGYCSYCAYPHREGTCSVCRAYKQYTGRPYWGHTYLHPMTEPGRLHRSAKVQLEPAADSSLYRDADDGCFTPSDDSECESLDGGSWHKAEARQLRRRTRTWSAPIASSRLPTARPVSPVVLRRSLRDRFGGAHGNGRRTPEYQTSSPTPSSATDDVERQLLTRSSLDSLVELQHELELAKRHSWSSRQATLSSESPVCRRED